MNDFPSRDDLRKELKMTADDKRAAAIKQSIDMFRFDYRNAKNKVNTWTSTVEIGVFCDDSYCEDVKSHVVEFLKERGFKDEDVTFKKPASSYGLFDMKVVLKL